MKATLEFTLPDEADEHQAAVDGQKWKVLVWNFDQELRSKVKYGPEDEKTPGYQDAREILRELTADSGLFLD